jgi:hypothetical protein
MSLSTDLMAAEAQIDAMMAGGKTLRERDAASLCQFLRECAAEAMSLEASALDVDHATDQEAGRHSH